MSTATPVDESAVVVPCPRIASRVIDGRAVVVVIDSRRLHTLNAVGTRVFELLDGRPLGEVAKVVHEEFDVSYEQALADVEAFAVELLDAGVVKLETR